MEASYRWDVFLAHPSPAKPRARRLAELLRERGVSVCLDEEVLRVGDDWQRALPIRAVIAGVATRRAQHAASV